MTLVGPGGVGKTRLLIEVGRRLLPAAAGPAGRDVRAGDGRRRTPRSTSSPRRSASTPAPASALADRIVDVLGDTEIVLLLDNCEHVLDPIAELVERLLARCPDVTVVATSRERLRVAGEQLSSCRRWPSDDEAPAVQLFVERARAVAADFDPTPGAARLVAEIVRRLDGLPLAIELAAARLHTLDVGEVAAGLDRRFRCCRPATARRPGTARSAPPCRGRSGCSTTCKRSSPTCRSSPAVHAADAAAVCGDRSTDDGDALASLVERSLVMRAPGRRYVLLETLRAFGAEQLAATAGWRPSPSATPATQSSGSRRRRSGWSSPVSRCPGGDRRRHPRAAHRARRGCSTTATSSSPAGSSSASSTTASCGCAPTSWPGPSGWRRRPRRPQPGGADGVGDGVYAAWMAGDVPESSGGPPARSRLAEQAGAMTAVGRPRRGASCAVRGPARRGRGGLVPALLDAAADDRSAQRLSRRHELLALAYAGRPRSRRWRPPCWPRSATTTPHAAYVWYCAGEAGPGGRRRAGPARYARPRAGRADQRVLRSSPASPAPRRRRSTPHGDPAVAAADYRRLIIDHWRRAGMWSTQWTMLRSIAGLLARLGRHRDAAVLEGPSGRPRPATASSARRGGARPSSVAVARGARRRRLRGGAAARGRVLDGDAAVEHALRAP